MRRHLRFSLRTWFFVLSAICIVVVVGRYIAIRRSLQERIIAEGTLVYDNNQRHAKTIQSFSSFGMMSSGPSPKVYLRDPAILPNLGKWTGGSLVVCAIDRLDANGSETEWVNELLASGELREIKLSGQDHEGFDLALVARNRNLESLRISNSLAKPDALAGLHRLKSLRELQIRRTAVNFQSLMKRGLPASLETVSLNSLQIHSDELIALATCRKLKSLNLSSNDLNLDALAEVGLPSTLEKLVLQKTNVTKANLRSTARCAHLKSLDLSRSAIDLRNCGDLVLPESLTDLNLANAILDASSFRMLSKLPNLVNLTLDEAEFTDEAAEGCYLAKSLKSFHARESGAGGNVAHAISQAMGLRSVNFALANIDDVGLAKLGEKSELKVLLLGGNALSDASTSTLAQYRNLSRLELLNTNITDELFQKAPHLLEIVDLRVDGSGVSQSMQARWAEVQNEMKKQRDRNP